MKITRRKLAGTVFAPGALMAQAPGPKPLPRTPDEELSAARAQNQRNAEALDKVRVPMSEEPAFVFKA